MLDTAGKKQTGTIGQQSMIVLLTLWLGHFAVDSFTGIWPIYKTLAGLDLVKAGLIATIGGFLGNALQILFGFLGDRGWSRILISMGVLAAGSISLVSYVDTSNYFLMGILVLLMYLGSSSFHPIGTGTASTLSAQNAGKLTAVFLSGGFVGYAFSQLLYMKIYQATNGRTAGMMIFSIAVAALLFYQAPTPPRKTYSLRDVWVSTLGFRRPLAYLYIILVFAAGLNMAMVFLLPDLLQAKQASNWLVFGGGHMLMVMGGCTGLLPAGHLADKYGPRQVMLVGLVAMGTSISLMSFFQGQNVMVLGVLLFLMGSTSSTCNVVGVAYGVRLMPQHARMVSGLLMGSAWCIAGVSTAIGGWLADPKYGGSPDSAILWLTLAVPPALLICYLLPRTKK
ncbi:MAG: MFS transporter [Deltaproteobacteria bacterium]|nr:MFS transporter [Deltaproteobacteria bacterium]MBT4641869.1 MFS transporter [Deltaproteobacteria bacterium]MBT6503365.1 MFS transporter [Deltaproteobacteria bacterium]MBT7155625.1 MFS transporter [Deltaproteobacteria bacterium]MBT7715547.1 MFS transporter [Deltaproteobacteria bacterium]